MTRCSHQQSPYQLLFGEPHIFEDLLGLKIRISPDAFFQINTAGAEMLYRTIGELSGVNSESVLLDICCGTGKWPASLGGVYVFPRSQMPSTQILQSFQGWQGGGRVDGIKYNPVGLTPPPK